MLKRECKGCGRVLESVRDVGEGLLLCPPCARDAMSDGETAGPSRTYGNRHDHLRDTGGNGSISHLRTVRFEFRDISVRHALEVMSNGSCGD